LYQVGTLNASSSSSRVSSNGDLIRYLSREDQVQSRAEDEGGTASHPVQAPESVSAVADPGDAAFVQSPPVRAREEMGMLLVGFATGLSIGLVFLVYVVLALAGLLH
jgi:hypothetical protein